MSELREMIAGFIRDGTCTKGIKQIKDWHIRERKKKEEIMSAPLYPTEDLRKRLEKLGIPREKHNLAELGERLPQFFIWEHSHMSQKNVFVFHTEKVRNGKEWFVDYQDLDGNSILHFLGHYKDKIQDKSEANARAKMLIYLLENKLIEEE